MDNYLNDTVFCQAVAALTITRELLVEECPYDLNGNGELDYWGATANQERQIIQNLLGPFDPEEKHIFIVGRIEAYAGFAVDLGSRDAFVSQRSLLGERSEQDMMYIIAHELGHSFGCLPDLDVNVDCLTTPGVDPENLMSYCNQGQHMAAPALRYGQWDLLQQSNPQN